MKDLRQWLILGGSIVALTVAVVLGIWWFMAGPKPPAPDQPAEVQTEAPEELDVTLPENLEQKMQSEQTQRDRLYAQAVEAHRAGRLDEAAQSYRDAIALSIPDETAAQSYRLLGDIYSRNDQWERAIRLYEFAVEIDPETAFNYYRLGKARDETGDYSGAAKAFDRAIEREPRGLYFLARGNLDFDRGEAKSAVKFYRRGLETGEERRRLLINLGIAEQARGNFVEARDAYRNAREMNLEKKLQYLITMNLGELLMREGKPQEAAGEFEQATELRDDAESNYNLGLARLEAGLWTGAVEALEQARSRSPEDPEIVTDLGFAYQQIEEYQSAVEQYEAAIDLRPQQTDLYLAAARLYERLDRSREALNYYRELTERLPPNQQELIWRRVGELYMNLNQPEEAAPAFRNALRVDTGNPEIHYNLGLSYHRTDQLDRAVNEFEQALSADPSDTHYQFVYASTLYRAGFRDRSRAQFEQIYTNNPDQHRAGYMMAYIDQSRGKLDSARKRYQSLLSDAEDPRLRSAIFENLGEIYVQNEQFSRAKTVLRQALNVQETPMTFYNMGLLFAEQKRWNEANSAFRLALDRGGEDPRIYAGLGLVMYERGLYQESESFLQQALERDPSLSRARFDLRRVQQQLEEAS